MAKATTPPINGSKINASPTKEFFISMLIRDITLKDAIGDLVDNSVDGARQITKNKNYNGLSIDIIANKNEFIIEDNCGGFSVDIARKYAFRFGRPSDFAPVKGSVGQFGIGMKRAIFKLGANIVITSKTETTSFKLTINVNKWRNEPLWDFEFDDAQEGKKFPKTQWGTKIHITNLLKETTDQFSDRTFLTSLNNEIAKENMYNIQQGLKISINGTKLKSEEIFLISNKDIKPAHQEVKIGKVTINLYAGIGKDDLREGGWYIFCNDRLVIGPDQSNITGWTGKGKDGVATYHDQFSRFRGYVFFSSENASDLPWNTTKTSMDLDSALYIAIRQRMIEMMKPVITFLNKLKLEKEKDNPIENQPLNLIANESKEETLTTIQKKELPQVFTFPNLTPRREPASEAKISYSKKTSKVNAIKKFLGLSSNKEVGEKTFDYFYENEIG